MNWFIQKIGGPFRQTDTVLKAVLKADQSHKHYPVSSWQVACRFPHVTLSNCKLLGFPTGANWDCSKSNPFWFKPSLVLSEFFRRSFIATLSLAFLLLVLLFLLFVFFLLGSGWVRANLTVLLLVLLCVPHGCTGVENLSAGWLTHQGIDRVLASAAQAAEHLGVGMDVLWTSIYILLYGCCSKFKLRCKDTQYIYMIYIYIYTTYITIKRMHMYTWQIGSWGANAYVAVFIAEVACWTNLCISFQLSLTLTLAKRHIYPHYICIYIYIYINHLLPRP